MKHWDSVAPERNLFHKRKHEHNSKLVFLLCFHELYPDESNNAVFPKWIRIAVNSANLGNLKNHWSFNWAQFKDPVSHMCLAGAVVESWSITQEVAGSNNFFNFFFVTEFSEFSENIYRKPKCVTVGVEIQVFAKCSWYSKNMVVHVVHF